MTREEYEKKFAASQKISGFGADTTIHMPCPGCAEADFAIYRVIDAQAEMANEHICQHCGIGVKAVFDTDHPFSVGFEFVQTQGPELPSFLAPMRRASEK